MTELHGIIEHLVEVICKTLKLDTQESMSVIASFSKPRLADSKFPLEHIKQNLMRQTPEENPDRALLLLLLKTVELIHPLISTNTLFNPTQTTEIHAALVNIITTFNALFTGPQNEIPRTSSGSVLNSFIIDEAYTDVAELISNYFAGLLHIAHRSPHELPQKITHIIEQYQEKVEPDFLRAENRRLHDDIIRLQTQVAVQQEKIELLTAQSATEAQKFSVREKEQQRPNILKPAKKMDNDFLGFTHAISNLSLFSDTKSRRSSALRSAVRSIEEATASITTTTTATHAQNTTETKQEPSLSLYYGF